MTFEELAEFIDKRMRMSHVYQPVMLKRLLEHGGESSEEEIARALLGEDQSQIEYYQQITRHMVGRVLRKHGIVIRDRDSRRYQLVGFDNLTREQLNALAARCDSRLQEFLSTRGDQPWQHRKRSAGYVSGTLRYEVLKAAQFHCELCGVAASERALEVDHIVPRSRGGSDDVSNLQALCYRCNAMKRDRDDTDFSEIRRSFNARNEECTFCSLPTDRIKDENTLAVAIEDAFPVTQRHTLVIPRRHVASMFDLGRSEINACMQLLGRSRADILNGDSTVVGFNVGVNDGQAAGQTVFHCHWHLIPRRKGDVENPRGGVRHTIPGKGDY